LPPLPTGVRAPMLRLPAAGRAAAAALQGTPRMSDLSTRLRFLVALTAALAILVVFGLPLATGRVYTYDGIRHSPLPMRAFYASCLRNGDAWDWWPDVCCGFYLQGEGQAGLYHPLHLLLYRTLPLPAALDLEVLLNYPFLLLGTYLFLRRRRLP